MRSVVALLMTTALVAASTVDQARAQSCEPQNRTPFAGHAFPLEGSFLEENLAFVPAFPDGGEGGVIGLVQPTLVIAPPDGTNRLFFVERAGQVISVPNRPDTGRDDKEVVLDLSNEVLDDFIEEGLLGLAFHPDFNTNGFFYVSYTAETGFCAENPRCHLIVRYQIDPADPERALPGSRYVVLEIERPGSASGNNFHNGGMIAFGGDGYLYASIGDQGMTDLVKDTSSLRGKILRVDVDSGTERAPGIPAANPFGTPVLHMGLRNPWRISFDRDNPDDLWIADVGSREREEVTWLPAGTPPGLDLGWPDCEGTFPRTQVGCDPSQRGPDIEYVRNGGRLGVIGGYVYRGSLASLLGHYVFGDINGTIYSWDRSTRDPVSGLAIFEEELSSSLTSIASFGEDEAGELYTWNYFAISIPGRLVGAGASPGGSFPEQLSETGLFTDVASLTPAPGLIEYDLNTVLWSDGALKRRWLALPGTEQIGFTPTGEWHFPVGTATVKHFELDQPGAPPRRLETRVFLRQTDRWIGLTYRWNSAQTEATLLVDELEEEISLSGGGSQTWRYPSPSDCLGCHTPAGGRVLGIRTRQLNRDFTVQGVFGNQLASWSCLGLFDTAIGDPTALDALTPLDDGAATIASRARSYLEANCSMCHQPGAGVSEMDLRDSVLLGDMNAISHPPIRGDLGLPSPMLIDPGDHTNSIVSLRTEAADPTLRMARGTLLEDTLATSVLASWIDDVLFDSGSGSARLDSDDDGFVDSVDNCPARANPSQENADADLLGDACDPDQLPDLRPTTSLPAQVGAGDAVFLSASVENEGFRVAGTSLVRFRLSLDDEVDVDDFSLGDCFADPIADGDSESCGDVVTIPPELAGSTDSWHFITCADSLERVDEGDETDNCVADVVLIPEPAASANAIAALLSVGVVVWMRRRTAVDARSIS